jgi:PAS domain S-box-containing protein
MSQKGKTSFTNQYQKILFSLPDIIFVFDENAVFVEYYNSGKDQLFLSKEEFIGKHIRETKLPEPIKRTTEKIIEKVIKTGKENSFRYSLEIQQETRHFEARFFPLDNTHVFTIIRDISNIKRAESVQKHLKEYYQQILDRMDHGVAETDREGKIVYVNHTLLEITGKNKGKLSGKNFFEEFALEEEQEEVNNFIKRIESGKEAKRVYSFESKKLKKVKDRFFQIIVYFSVDNSNKVDLLNIDIADTTKIKQKHDSLEKSEQTYRSLVENSPNGILIRDEEKILYANPAAISILGFKDLDHALGFTIENLYLPEFSDKIRKRLDDLKNKEQVSYAEVKVKRPIDGVIIEVETIPARIYYEGIEAFQIVIKDISLQKRLLETKLRADLAEENYLKLRKEIVIRQEMEQELSKSLEEKSILLKEVHHRVKNNLQIISSILNLEIKSQTNTDVNKAFKRIQSRISSIYLIHEIVYQTDMFSRIDLGQYIRLISENMIRNSGYEKFNFKFCFDKVFVSLDIGVPIGMIINELFYNYLEHHDGFDVNKPMKITMKQQNMQTEIQIHYPKVRLFKTKVPVVESSLSSQLIDALTDQINGTYKVLTDKEKNTIFILQF